MKFFLQLVASLRFERAELDNRLAASVATGIATRGGVATSVAVVVVLPTRPEDGEQEGDDQKHQPYCEGEFSHIRP